VEEHASCVNKLGQNIGLETWIWRHKERTPNTNNYHMPEWNCPIKIFCVRHWSLHVNAFQAVLICCSHAWTRFSFCIGTSPSQFTHINIIECRWFKIIYMILRTDINSTSLWIMRSSCAHKEKKTCIGSNLKKENAKKFQWLQHYTYSWYRCLFLYWN